jgi:hypothetical protein
MTDAERRAENLRRVSTNFGEEHVVPGLTGTEVLFLAGFNRHTANKGKTEYEGGWQASRHERYFRHEQAQEETT